METNIEMVSNNILVYIELPKTETEAGFIKGDKILLPPHGNTPISYKGEIFHVFRETSLFAKVNG